ncbi:MAG: cell division protein FtsZ [Candidatus Symbiothrix sp.]|jgi:cell division protein FtsZ|nr:cell division protein FtsZ [Candidatus Symbiothrix sp.]
MEEILTGFAHPKERATIIKVIGVGGGGGNAVTHMYKEGIQDVSFALCNTDNQAMLKSDVPVRVQLGTSGLGAGNNPEKALQDALNSQEDIKKLLSDGTEMVFVTAGMGGGTGTGAAPVIAQIAKDMGILTIGIITIPFLFEGMPKIVQALRGTETMRKSVDALLVINNQKLVDIYGDMTILECWQKADDILSTAARSIAELITKASHMNTDFADVKTTLQNGGVAIMNTGFGDGERRVEDAFDQALKSPLLNNNKVFDAHKVLFHIYYTSAKPLKGSEMTELRKYMSQFSQNPNIIWGEGLDEDLEHEIKITVLAAGYGSEDIPHNELLHKDDLQKQRETAALIDIYYGSGISNELGSPPKPVPYIFNSITEMENDALIENLLNEPAYRRK